MLRPFLLVRPAWALQQKRKPEGFLALYAAGRRTAVTIGDRDCRQSSATVVFSQKLRPGSLMRPVWM